MNAGRSLVCPCQEDFEHISSTRRWALGKRQFLGGPLWLRLHMLTQTLGLGCLVAGFVMAWVYLQAPNTLVALLHKFIGTIAFGLTCCQVSCRDSLPGP